MMYLLNMITLLFLILYLWHANFCRSHKDGAKLQNNDITTKAQHNFVVDYGQDEAF